MINKIITHHRPHADELVSLMLLKKFPEGEALFPGVKNAEVSFLTTGELPEGKTAVDFPDTIFLGCGGGEFDEHATSKKEREEGETCLTLVARRLSLHKDPGLQKIIHFIREEDLKGSKVKNELPMIIKLLHAAYPNEPIKISEWVQVAYYAIYKSEKENLTKEDDWQRPTLENVYDLLRKQGSAEAEEWKKFGDSALLAQQKRFDDAKKEFSEKGKMEKIIAWDGKPLSIGSITSDNEEINKYVRSIGAHLVVHFNSRGNVAIMTDTKRKIDLTKAFVLLRMAEQHYRGKDNESIKIKDEEILSKEGFVEGIPYWYLFHTRAMGFNGSTTTIGVEPTKIPHEKVVELIKESLK